MPWTTPGTAVAGEVLTAARWNTDVRDNTNELYSSVRRLGFQSRTTNYDVNQTALASAADVFASDITFTADGTSTYWVEFFSAQVQTAATATNSIVIYLVDGSGGDLGIIAYYTTPAASILRAPVHVRVPYTPASGSRSINVRAVYVGGAGIIIGGAGGAATYVPAWLALYGPNLT